MVFNLVTNIIRMASSIKTATADEALAPVIDACNVACVLSRCWHPGHMGASIASFYATDSCVAQQNRLGGYSGFTSVVGSISVTSSLQRRMSPLHELSYHEWGNYHTCGPLIVTPESSLLA